MGKWVADITYGVEHIGGNGKIGEGFWVLDPQAV
jgi:hypothetical protein